MHDDGTIDELGLTRRQALAAAAALCGLGAVAATGTGVAQASGTWKVTLSKYPELSRVGGAAVVGSHNGVQVAVVRTAAKKYVALDRRCPHRGASSAKAATSGYAPCTSLALISTATRPAA